jgi:DnaJ-domain-containing protein 1
MGDSEQSRDDEAFVERRAPRPRRAFPGGQARLPRLQRPAGAPDDLLEDEPDDEDDSPLRRNPDERSPGKDRGFEAYYSNESLFEQPEPAAGVDPDGRPVEGPYGVLGLRRNASWEEVSRAHRKLVSQLHPDRYVGSDDEEREAAERRVRDVNEAYATIRRERAVQRV